MTAMIDQETFQRIRRPESACLVDERRRTRRARNAGQTRSMTLRALRQARSRAELLAAEGRVSWVWSW